MSAAKGVFSLGFAFLVGCGAPAPMSAVSPPGPDAAPFEPPPVVDAATPPSEDAAAPQFPGATYVIRNARVFDGERVLPVATVVIGAEGTIAYVGPDLAPPPSATIVDGAGRTLMPGLIDAHTHTWEVSDLRQALLFGVTTELDMMGDPALLRQVREAHARGELPDVADYFGAGDPVTVPGGHGTEYGIPIPTLGPNDDAYAFVAARIAEGSDYIKIMHEDGATFGETVPTLSRAQLAASVAATHSLGRIAVVHVSGRDAARDAIDAGADGLAHLWVDGADDALAQSIASGDHFVTATLSVLYSECDGTRGATLADDPRLAPYLSDFSKSTLRERFTIPGGPVLECARVLEGLASLRRAGAIILAGTDTPNSGVAHGVSLHDELALLVAGGLTPVEALIAATSRPADVFSLGDRGRIRLGASADLVLVDGDPTTRIEDTRNFVVILRHGVPIDRDALRRAL